MTILPGGHAQGLMGALVVIGVHPAIHRVLGRGQRLERYRVVEELLRALEAFLEHPAAAGDAYMCQAVNATSS